uniref:Oleosin-2 n=1 Tax=Spirogyra grevilleana TaxID=3182 RepID=M4N3A2_9VIRI|nr:oleosin-2 [Spirogyra grevilleana]
MPAQRRHSEWRSRDLIFTLALFGLLGSILTFTIGTTVIGGGGILVITSPLLLLFSPILVPLGIFAFITTGVALGLGGTFLLSLSSVMWVYNYLTGRHPIGSPQLDALGQKVKDTTEFVGEKVHEATRFG